MTLRSTALSLLAMAALTAACGGESIGQTATTPTPTPSATPTQAADPIPRLAAGPHLGMITGFDMLDSQRAAREAALYDEAEQAGLSISRIQIDWSELETGPGIYDPAPLDEALANPQLRGLPVYFTLSTLDSDGITFPGYLAEADGLRDGLTLTSPQVREAFDNFLSWLAPRLEAENVWALSIGNEIDAPIFDEIVPEADAVAFFRDSFRHWETLSDTVAVTLTATTAAPRTTPDLVATIREEADFVTVNYYCLDQGLQVTGPDRWDDDLAAIKANAGTSQIFFQELGCPVGYDAASGQTRRIGGSDENQRTFLAWMGEQIAADPQLRGATMFQLLDWSPELAASFSQPVRDAGEDAAADLLEEWLATSGLCRWSDGSCRSGWTEWLAQLEAVKAARAAL